jgi:hypothetical protein
MFSLAELRGSSAVVLFWNPACTFCRQMLPDLKRWARRSQEAAQLLLISAGSVADNRKLGLRCRIVLDQKFKAGRTFGATGTPAGVRLDTDGLPIGRVAAGSQEIFESICRR